MAHALNVVFKFTNVYLQNGSFKTIIRLSKLQVKNTCKSSQAKLINNDISYY